MWNRRVRIWAATWLRRIAAGLAVDAIQTFGAFVVRLQRVVVDRPRRRRSLQVLQVLEILPPQTIEHAAPEFAVAAHVVVAVGRELATARVEPHLARLVPQMFPDRFGIPVLIFLRDEVATFNDQYPRCLLYTSDAADERS